MILPNPGMTFTPLDPLPASDLNDIVENVEALATYFGEPTADWNGVGATPNTVTYNGNRSYNLVFNSVDLTSFLSAGMRLKLTRTVTAPTQCTSLNGTNQYYSKSSPAGAAQTDDITVMGWVKPSSYAAGGIISKTATAGTDGWRFYMDSNGTLVINGGTRYGVSYQSLPLNKWTHVAASIDMSASSALLYFDGVLVASAALTSAGASWTSAGNLEVGRAGTNYFPGKIAQAAVFSAVLSAATIKSYYSQGLAGTETSLVSAYSFNNSISDLNTTNANNLTANGSAVATNADSPFGYQASGTISSTLDYAIVQKVSFSTNTTVTVQVPEGCTIPTSGGVSAVAYSGLKAPYGMPLHRGRWALSTFLIELLKL